LWRVVNKLGNLRYFIIETAFSNAERELAMRLLHLCPSLLLEQLAMLALARRQQVEIFITHLKSGEGDKIMREIALGVSHRSPKMLRNNQVFEF
jgi:hypothetical protein